VKGSALTEKSVVRRLKTAIFRRALGRPARKGEKKNSA
jgi:hypothetical protein